MFTMTNKKKTRIGKRFRDLGIEIAIGIAVVGVIVGIALYVPSERRLQAKWINLAAMTPVTFGYPLKLLRHYWHRRMFWCAFLILLSAHLGAFVIFLSKVDQFGGLWFVMINFLEWSAIFPALEWAGNYPSTHRH